MGDLPIVRRLRQAHSGQACPVPMTAIARDLKLPEFWQTGDVIASECSVFDQDGTDLTSLYLIVAADDSTPQYPDGIAGVLIAYAAPGGEILRQGMEYPEMAVRQFYWPGIQIVGPRFPRRRR